MKNNKTLIPQCVHIMICGNIVVLAIITAFLFVCGDDGIITQRELRFAFEYFFVCVTEILFFSLAFDLIYKYEKRRMTD